MVTAVLKFLPVFGGFSLCWNGVLLFAKSRPCRAAGKITETALCLLVENIFRDVCLLALTPPPRIQNVLDNLPREADYGLPLFLTEAIFLARWLSNTLALSYGKPHFWSCITLLIKVKSLFMSLCTCVFVCTHGSDRPD